MKPAIFVYHAPRTVEDAVAILADVASHDGRVLAGGQSLVPAMALRLALPSHLVDINGVAELDRLAVEGSELSIGACVRHAAFHGKVVEGPLGRLLSEVVRHIAHYPIRTRGTFCGSLANADPASEWCLVTATLSAKIRAKSMRGQRTIAIENYFKGLMTTALEPDELLTEVSLPVLAPDTRCGFYEFNRRAGDFAVAMALTTFRVEHDVIVDSCIGVGGVEGHPRRITESETLIQGRPPGSKAFRAAADIAAEAVVPLDATPAVAAYKRDVTRTAVRRALEMAEKSNDRHH